MKTPTDSRRSEKAGILNFTREMISALLMAFVAIVYVIQAFKIPTGSMKNSLLEGDFLLGIKFIYGAPVLPFSYTKLPGVLKPKPGDVIIFKYPGSDSKDYIKRCVAGPGQTIEIKQKDVYINDVLLIHPPKGRYERNGLLGDDATNYAKLRIPAKGDTLYPESMPAREFLFCKHLIHQENPELSFSARVMNTPLIRNISPYKYGQERTIAKYSLYINDEFQTDLDIKKTLNRYMGAPSERPIDRWDILKSHFAQIKLEILGKHKQAYTMNSDTDSLSDSVSYEKPKIEIKKMIFLDDKRIESYIVKNDNFFMMGDNRDNSLDSRYWGYLNKNFIKAKAFILYFSFWSKYEHSDGEEKLFHRLTGKLPPQKYTINGKTITSDGDSDIIRRAFFDINNKGCKWQWNKEGELVFGKPKIIPFYLFPLKIRWNRIGKLIRSWNGLEKL